MNTPTPDPTPPPSADLATACSHQIMRLFGRSLTDWEMARSVASVVSEYLGQPPPTPPDATATPRTDTVIRAAISEYMKTRAEWERAKQVSPSYIGVMRLFCVFKKHLSDLGLERELTAAKAEIARLNGKRGLKEIVDAEARADRAEAELESYRAREKCIACGTSWDPSLIEGGECIFCTLKKTQVRVEQAETFWSEWRTRAETAEAEVTTLRIEYEKEVAQLRAEAERLNAGFTPNGALARENECLRDDVARITRISDVNRQVGISLAADCDQLRARVSELEANGASEVFVAMSIRASTAEQRVAELEADKARLDWLIKDACIVEPTPKADAKLHIFTGPMHSRQYARAAIDVARKGAI